MMNESEIKRLFERRQFSEAERVAMKELYVQGEMLAQRILRTVPPGFHRDIAIYNIKATLAQCETAVAVDTKMTMNIHNSGAECGPSNAHADAELLRQRNQILSAENAELRMVVQKQGGRIG